MITLDVYRWQASCCYFLKSFRGDRLALSNIFQLLSTVISPHTNVHLNFPVLVCVYRGFDVGHVGSAPPHLRSDPDGHSEWLPLSAVPLWEENTHSHYNRLSCCCSVRRHSHLWLGLWNRRRDVWNISLKRLDAGQQLRDTEREGQLYI